jgi:DNA-binding NtrC family response regulator
VGRFYRVAGPRGTAPASAEAPAAGADAGGGYILIVDDERPVAEATKLLLEIEGFEVRLATCEREALAEVRARVPDLIISDFRLRGGETGLGVVKSVRRAANADVPAVFVTGDTSKLAVEAGELPNSEFLAKPLQADMLLTIVQRRIRKSAWT